MKITIVALIILLVYTISASAFTLSGTVSGAVQFGGISYIYALSTDTSASAPVFFFSMLLLGNGNYNIYNVTAGNYILLAYQDRDNTFYPTVNDYYGFYGGQMPALVTVNSNISGLNIALAPLPNTVISGSLTLNTASNGLVLLQAASDPDFNNIERFSILLDSTGNGEYYIFVEPGIYYVRAFVDLDVNFTLSPSDPSGYYGYPNPPQMVDVSGMAQNGIDFAIYDPLAVKPTPLTFVTSSITLEPAFPNPFNSQTNISFELTTGREASLKIFDGSGREVWSTANSQWSIGENRVVWEAKGHPSGIYFVRLQSLNQVLIERMVLLK